MRKLGAGSMPLAVDTNIVARALTDDGTDQSRKASECFRDNEVFISDTVMLETEWLLRSRLQVPRSAIRDLFAGLLSWPKIRFSDRERMVRSIEAHARGVDFADALHVLAANDCDAMLTFDDDFVRRADRIPGGIPVQFP